VRGLIKGSGWGRRVSYRMMKIEVKEGRLWGCNLLNL
jgi:hypothetical protein